MGDIGRWLVIIGIVIVVIGVIFMAAGRIPWLGKLPGDITWRKGDFTVSFPFATMIVVSIVLTIILNVITRLFK